MAIKLFGQEKPKPKRARYTEHENNAPLDDDDKFYRGGRVITEEQALDFIDHAPEGNDDEKTGLPRASWTTSEGTYRAGVDQRGRYIHSPNAGRLYIDSKRAVAIREAAKKAEKEKRERAASQNRGEQSGVSALSPEEEAARRKKAQESAALATAAIQAKLNELAMLREAQKAGKPIDENRMAKLETFERNRDRQKGRVMDE